MGDHVVLLAELPRNEVWVVALNHKERSDKCLNKGDYNKGEKSVCVEVGTLTLWQHYWQEVISQTG